MLGGCALIGVGEAPRDETGAINKEASADAFKIRNGDCLNDPGEGDIERVPVVPCATLHEFEVFHEFEPHGNRSTRRADDAMRELVGPTCETAFKAFVGIDIEESQLDFTTLQPSALSWAEGDRTRGSASSGIRRTGRPPDRWLAPTSRSGPQGFIA